MASTPPCSSPLAVVSSKYTDVSGGPSTVAVLVALGVVEELPRVVLRVHHHGHARAGTMLRGRELHVPADEGDGRREVVDRIGRVEGQRGAAPTARSVPRLDGGGTVHRLVREEELEAGAVAAQRDHGAERREVPALLDGELHRARVEGEQRLEVAPDDAGAEL